VPVVKIKVVSREFIATPQIIVYDIATPQSIVFTIISTVNFLEITVDFASGAW